tara:strand:+ start:14066 stop:18262 length:4197 start_codon:yes stop_codon:yes gene_type:complete
MTSKPTYEDLINENILLKERLHRLDTNKNEADPNLNSFTNELIHYKTIADATQDFVLIVDADFNILYVNKAYPGTKKEDAIGSSLLNFVPEDFKKEAISIYQSVLNTGVPATYEAEYELPDGNTQQLEVSVLRSSENSQNHQLTITTKDITEKNKHKKELQKSEEFNRSITETAADAIITINEKLEILFWNKASESIFGYTAQEVLKTDLSKLIPERYFKEGIDPLEYFKTLSSKNKDATSSQLHCVRKDGSELPIILTISSWEWAGNTFYTGILRDVSSIMRTQRKLKKNEAKYQELFDNSPVVILEEDLSFAYQKYIALKEAGVTDIKTHLFKHPQLLHELVGQIRVLNVNKAAVSFLQATNKTQVLNHITDTFTEATLTHFSQVISAILNEETQVEGEIELLSFENNVIHGLVKVQLEYETGKKPRLIGKISITDITDRKKMMMELKESEAKFKNLSNLSFEGIVVHNNGIVMEVNQTFSKISGYSPAEIIGQNIIEFMIPDKYKPLLIANLKVPTVDSYEIEFRKKNGELLPIEIEARSLPSVNGENRRVVAARDITERIKNRQQTRTLAAAVNQSSNTIVITDTEGTIEYVNPQFTKDSGYTLEEALGKNPRILSSGRHPREYYQIMWDTILSGKTWEGEFHNKAKNGKLYWERVIMNPIKDNAGGITHFLAIKENITQRKVLDNQLKIAHKKLMEREKKFRSLFEKSIDAVVLVTNGIISECNEAAIKLMGLSNKRELLQLPLGKISLEFQLDKEAAVSKMEDMMQLCLKNGSHRFEWTHVNPNKQELPIEVSMTTIFNQPGEQIIHSIWRDMTVIKNNEQELLHQNSKLEILSDTVTLKNKMLERSETKYRSLLNQSPISIWEENFKKTKSLIEEKTQETEDIRAYLDENPEFVNQLIQSIRIKGVNNATLELLGAKDETELKTNLASNFTTNSIAVFKEEIISILNGEKEHITEAEFVQADGTLIHTILKMVITDDDYNGIVTMTDITEQKKAEARLIQMNTELQQQTDKAEESSRLKTEFLNNMSHEIRTPMNGILGFTQFLAENNLSENERKQYISIIQNSATQLLHVIDDILEISKLGTKQVKVINTEVCLNTVLIEQFSVFNIKAKENGTPLYLKKELSDMESTIFTDKTKLNKIIENLIENALKFTREGFIEFGYLLKNSQIVLYVKDTGIGIEKQNFETIFDRFSQAEKTLSRNVGGLGLGLCIAKENALLLGGDIKVESVLNEGSTFFVTLPFKRMKKIEAPVEISTPKTPLAHKYTILVAEDEEINFLYLEIILRSNSLYQPIILHAKDGQEAIEMYNVHPEIDLILMDLKMPVLDGFEATKRLKQLNPTLPIIAQTAYSTDKEREAAHLAGCDDFISKPIDKQEFNKLVYHYLSQNESKAE